MVSEKNDPLVSLILVVRNEVRAMEDAIASYVAQDYPDDAREIIIVDGCSNDGTREKAEELVEDLKNRGIHASLIDNPEKILAAGWDLAIHAARGEYVCRIDAHSMIAPDYVRRAVELFREPQYEKAVAIGGVIAENIATTSFGRLTADLYGSKFGVGNSPFRIPPKEIIEADTTVFGLYRRNVILNYGFNQSLKRNQDVDFHNRLRKDGWKLIVNPKMHVRYETRGTFCKLLKKGYNDGVWIPFSGGALRHRIPLCFVLYLIFLLITLCLPWLWLKALAAIPMLFYILLAIYFAFRDGTTAMSKLLLPFIFFSFHISYGLGTCMGYLNKIVRRTP